MPGNTSDHFRISFSKTNFSEACIKGHRSSSCQHVDRPLFQLRRKGRPTSQCQKCKSARKSGSFHGKCACEVQPETSLAGRTTFLKGMTSNFTTSSLM